MLKSLFDGNLMIFKFYLQNLKKLSLIYGDGIKSKQLYPKMVELSFLSRIPSAQITISQ